MCARACVCAQAGGTTADSAEVEAQYLLGRPDPMQARQSPQRTSSPPPLSCL